MQVTRLLAAATCLAAAASAQFSVVVPNGYATGVENSGNAFPFASTITGTVLGLRIQHVYDSSHLTNQLVNYPIQITGLRWRSDDVAVTTTWTGGTYNTCLIQMSTAAVDYLATTTNYTTNHGANLQTVHNGPVVVQPGSGNGVGVPGPWIVDVQFPTTPFLYDPNQGDLAVEVDIPQGAWGGGGLRTLASVAVGANPPAVARRVFGSTLYPNANGVDENILVMEIQYTPAAGLYSGFTSNVRGGASPLAVQFTDASYSSDPGGVTGWAWDLDGDSIIDSTLQNPTFVYNSCGSYNVTLTVTDAAHSPSTLTRTAWITTDVVTPSFTFAQIAPGVIQFTDTSTPTPTSWAWDLDGDNIVDSTVQNPVFVYQGACPTARVTLTASRLCQPAASTSQTLVLSPASLMTTFAGGNGLSAVGSGNTFDIQVTNPDGISICALSVAPYMATPVLGTPLACTIWVTDAPGGYLANHTNAAVWRQVATGTGTFAGGTFTAPVPVVMALSNPVYIPQGTYGMAVHMTAGSGVAYTNVTAPFTYNGPDFDIIAGNGKGSPFASTANAGRGFNGMFHYSTTTNGQSAGYGFMGAGCAGTLPIANLAHNAPPAVGTTLSVTVNNLPVSQMVMLTGFSNTTSLFGPLPFNGAPVGAPGCMLRASTEAVLFRVGAGNQAVWNFNIVNDPVFIGQKFYNQALVLDPLANALGAVTSDAAAFVIGL